MHLSSKREQVFKMKKGKVEELAEGIMDDISAWSADFCHSNIELEEVMAGLQRDIIKTIRIATGDMRK